MVSQEHEDNNNKETKASITIKTNAKREVYGEYTCKQLINETDIEYFDRLYKIRDKFESLLR